METNSTLLDDVVSDDFQTPSTSTFFEDEQPARDLLIGDLPETDPYNITGMVVNVTSTNHTVLEQFFKTIESLVDESTFIVYTIAAIITILLIVITCSIVVWLIKHKKRVIQQDNDPILASTYTTGFSWKRCCACCSGTANKQSQLQARQNSASNLDPYRRPPLPPIGVKPDTYIGTFNRPDALDGMKKSPTLDERTLAVNIQTIRGVPHIHLRPEQYRNLPPLKMRYE